MDLGTGANAAAIVKINQAYSLATGGLPPGSVAAATTVHTEMSALAKQFDAARQAAIPGVVSFLGSVAKAAPSIMPFVNESTGVFSGFLNDLSRGMQSPGFKDFMTTMAGDVKPIMGQFATWTENVGMTFGKFLELFGGGPAAAVGSWADRTSARLLGAFGEPASKGYMGMTLAGVPGIIGAHPATGFFKDINVQAMDATFDAIGHVVGLTLRAIGRLLIAAEPAGAAVGALVGGLDKLVLALPKQFETDLIEIALTTGALKKLLPFIGADLFKMKDGVFALDVASIAAGADMVIAAADIVLAYKAVTDFFSMLHAVQAEHDAENYEKQANVTEASKLYKRGDTGGMTAFAAAVTQEAKTTPMGQQKDQLTAQAQYYTWAAKQMAAGKKINSFGQFTEDASSAAGVKPGGGIQMPTRVGAPVVVHVYVDGKELTNTVTKVVDKQAAGQVARMHSGKVLG